MEFLQHYQQCKQSAPSTTTATIVLPVWSKASWWPIVRNWKPVKFFPKGTPLFLGTGDRDSRPKLPTKWPVVVLYDGPEVTTRPPVVSSSGDNLFTCSTND